VSFLMPYIDFSFMLIIIFVGMLSIAYFEPLGSTDIETQQDSTIDQNEGEFLKKPSGIQKKIEGVGEETPDEQIVPLVPGVTEAAGGGEVSKLEVDRLRKILRDKEQELKRLQKLAAELRADKHELERLRQLEQELLDKKDQLDKLRQMEQEIEKLRAELEQLRKTQGEEVASSHPPPETPETTGKKTGKDGDHFYMDLRHDGKE